MHIFWRKQIIFIATNLLFCRGICVLQICCHGWCDFVWYEDLFQEMEPLKIYGLLTCWVFVIYVSDKYAESYEQLFMQRLWWCVLYQFHQENENKTLNPTGTYLKPVDTSPQSFPLISSKSLLLLSFHLSQLLLASFLVVWKLRGKNFFSCLSVLCVTSLPKWLIHLGEGYKLWSPSLCNFSPSFCNSLSLWST